MNSKRLPKRSVLGISVCAAPGSVCAGSLQAGTSVTHGKAVAAGIIQACKNDPSTGNSFYTLRLDDGTLKEYSTEEIVMNRADLKTTVHGKHSHAGLEKIPLYCKSEEGVPELEQKSPPHTLLPNGRKLEDCVHVDDKSSVGRLEDAKKDPLPQSPAPVHEQSRLLMSSYIPVPNKHRRPLGHADMEVMAATVLTTLSTSPLVLSPPSGTPGGDPCSRGGKEALSASYSSSTSGNWSWDTSDQSVPSTPSPPLPADSNKSFLLSYQSDDNIEASVTTHFLFEDPIPRKRKNSMKVMFKCLWKNCEKVLSTSSGIQRHIRIVHLGRNSDSDCSDGEEDFYYSEIEVNMDSLSEGLSSLTPTSPTSTAPHPPVFPLRELPLSEPALIRPWGGKTLTPLSQSAPSTLCHIRTDHAYQATVPVSIPVSSKFIPSENGISISWQSPPVIFKGSPGSIPQIRTVSIGEKRQPLQHTTVPKTHAALPSAPKPATGTRKPRGEAKKCRKVYGMEKRDMWCTACRWKKACQRFID
ncbi:zinc finger protein 704-like isoform X1 [Polyodon spathula]|uniref:zinc finger protein 704-like isoform X1 n=1 Tax=Polyodon spathula TaxID=7913 RepID=UPI001B7E4436|nr:zinc finger protein 704-like isoform X1 [Polyodon spathula]